MHGMGLQIVSIVWLSRVMLNFCVCIVNRLKGNNELRTVGRWSLTRTLQKYIQRLVGLY